MDYKIGIGLFILINILMYGTMIILIKRKVEIVAKILFFTIPVFDVLLFNINILSYGDDSKSSLSQIAGDIYHNLSSGTVITAFIIIGVVAYICISNIISDAVTDTADVLVSCASDIAKGAWDAADMNKRIERGMVNAYIAISGIYKGFTQKLTRDNIYNWIEEQNYDPNTIIIIEKEIISVTDVVVKCKVLNENGKLSEEVYWRCQTIEYQLERYIGRNKVKDI